MKFHFSYLVSVVPTLSSWFTLPTLFWDRDNIRYVGRYVDRWQTDAAAIQAGSKENKSSNRNSRIIIGRFAAHIYEFAANELCIWPKRNIWLVQIKPWRLFYLITWRSIVRLCCVFIFPEWAENVMWVSEGTLGKIKEKNKTKIL